MQSTFTSIGSGLHVAIIMDGNGRWGVARRQSRSDGHRAGADAVRRVVEAAPDLGIGTLSLFAFSSDNWKRPEDEVAMLMCLFAQFLRARPTRSPHTASACPSSGAAIGYPTSSGRSPPPRRRRWRERGCPCAWPSTTRRATRSLTPPATFPRARRRRASDSRSDCTRRTADGRPTWTCSFAPGGEHRLSDFLLWESAYAELLFVPRMWPDFTGTDLADAVAEFRRRERRFGSLVITAPAAQRHA